jgi:hypothetical protein
MKTEHITLALDGTAEKIAQSARKLSVIFAEPARLANSTEVLEIPIAEPVEDVIF